MINESFYRHNILDGKCNVDKCLRKYKSPNTGISPWCGVVGDKLDIIQPNTKKCPLYCDKFFCYETGKIIKKHDDTYWVNDDLMEDSYKELYKIKAKDVKFSGLSKAGNEKQKHEYNHSNTSHIICPYCDYEIYDVWDYIDSSYDDYKNIDCPECEKEFEVSIHREVTFSTNRIDNE